MFIKCFLTKDDRSIIIDRDSIITIEQSKDGYTEITLTEGHTVKVTNSLQFFEEIFDVYEEN